MPPVIGKEKDSTTIYTILSRIVFFLPVTGRLEDNRCNCGETRV